LFSNVFFIFFFLAVISHTPYEFGSWLYFNCTFCVFFHTMYCLIQCLDQLGRRIRAMKLIFFSQENLYGFHKTSIHWFIWTSLTCVPPKQCLCTRSHELSWQCRGAKLRPRHTRQVNTVCSQAWCQAVPSLHQVVFL